MKNIHLILIIIVLSIIAVISSQEKTTTSFNNEEKNIDVTIKDTSKDTKNTIDLEEYIIGVVAGEMPASFDIEALKAQAIAARSYAIYKMNTTKGEYDLTTDVSNQVYITVDEMKEKWQNEFLKYYEKVKKAVMDTKGLVMKYNNEVISSYYFAISNGKTEDVSLVFGESRDYLKSVESKDENVKNFLVTKNINREEFCKKLEINCDNIVISNINKSASGRVNEIEINEKKFKGTELRKILDLRSTDFEIKINNQIEITTRGYGHGVGMSQYGANQMAKSGNNYEEILKHYYQNIEISKINV